MTIRSFARFSSLAVLAFVASLGVPVAPGAAHAEEGVAATRRELAPGVLHRTRVYQSLFGGKQTVNIVELAPRAGAAGLELRMLLPAEGRPTARVSAMARAAGAVAAVNGGYFGGGFNYSLVKSGGRIVGRNVYPRTSLGVTPMGRLVMRVVPSSDPFAEAVEAVGGGPRLVAAGRIRVPLQEEHVTQASGIGPFTTGPRTAAGITPAGTLLLVTVDGRSRHGRGMTLHELARYLTWLGAKDAMNLDGGGSTTCFVAGEGVVNYPSDGRERPVGAALAIVRR